MALTCGQPHRTPRPASDSGAAPFQPRLCFPGCQPLKEIWWEERCFRNQLTSHFVDFRDLWTGVLNYKEHNLAERFAFVAWSIWYNCNAARTNTTHLPLSIVYQDILERLQEFQSAQDLPTTSVSLPQLTHWIPPRSPNLKVNFDSAIFHNSQTAGIGVVIRDESGKVVGPLSERIPPPHTVDVAEALACRRAVSFAKELGIKSVIVALKRS